MGIFSRWFGPDEPVKGWWKLYTEITSLRLNEPVPRIEVERNITDRVLIELSECLFGLLIIRSKISWLYEGDGAQAAAHLDRMDAVIEDLWNQWLIHGGGPTGVMLRVAHRRDQEAE